MLSIISDDFSETSADTITLHLLNRDSLNDQLLPSERSQISSYILRNYPNQGFSKVRLQFNQTDLKEIPIRFPSNKVAPAPICSLDTVAQWLEAEVGWDANSQTLTFFRKGQVAQVTVDQSYLRVEGARIAMDLQIRMLAGTIRLPIKRISESLGIQSLHNIPTMIWMQLVEREGTDLP